MTSRCVFCSTPGIGRVWRRGEFCVGGLLFFCSGFCVRVGLAALQAAGELHLPIRVEEAVGHRAWTVQRDGRWRFEPAHRFW